MISASLPSTPWGPEKLQSKSASNATRLVLSVGPSQAVSISWFSTSAERWFSHNRAVGKESQEGGLCGGGFHAARNWLDQECNQLPEPAKWGFTDQWISRLKENSHKYGISLSFFSRSSGSHDYFFPCKFKALTFWYIIEEDCFQPLSEQSHGHHVHSPSKIIALSNTTACGKIRASLNFTCCCDLIEVSGGFSGSCFDWFKDEPGPEHGCWPGCLYHILDLQVVTLNTLQKHIDMFKAVSYH